MSIDVRKITLEAGGGRSEFHPASPAARRIDTFRSSSDQSPGWPFERPALGLDKLACQRGERVPDALAHELLKLRPVLREFGGDCRFEVERSDGRHCTPASEERRQSMWGLYVGMAY